MIPKLYQYAACPFCNKVRSILKYKGVDFETIEVHPLKKTEIGFSEYKAVPIYIDSNGTQVNDSTPIMRHIEAEFPLPKVFKTDLDEVRRDEEWLAWSERFVKGLPTAIYGSFKTALASFDYITKVTRFSWFERIKIKYLGAFVMMLVAKKIKKREQIENPNAFLAKMASEWAAGLKGSPFMGGFEPSASDLAVFGIIQPILKLDAGYTLFENAEFKAWKIRMEKLISGNTATHIPRDRA